MRNLDHSDNENPTFKSWRWMISDDENEKDDEKKDEERD